MKPFFSEQIGPGTFQNKGKIAGSKRPVYQIFFVGQEPDRTDLRKKVEQPVCTQSVRDLVLKHLKRTLSIPQKNY